MAMSNLELREGESQESLMTRIAEWVKDNHTDLAKLSNQYGKHSPCDLEDFIGLAHVAAHDAAKVALIKNQPMGFRSYFNRIYTSQCYEYTHRRVFTRSDIAPIIHETIGTERSSLQWGADDGPTYHAVDETTPQTIALLSESEHLLELIFSECMGMCLAAMKPKEKNVWELMLVGCNNIEEALGISRQRVEKLRDSGLARIRRLFAGIAAASVVDGEFCLMTFREKMADLKVASSPVEKISPSVKTGNVSHVSP